MPSVCCCLLLSDPEHEQAMKQHKAGYFYYHFPAGSTVLGSVESVVSLLACPLMKGFDSLRADVVFGIRKRGFPRVTCLMTGPRLKHH